jgi:hypothetical protein
MRVAFGRSQRSQVSQLSLKEMQNTVELCGKAVDAEDRKSEGVSQGYNQIALIFKTSILLDAVSYPGPR